LAVDLRAAAFFLVAAFFFAPAFFADAFLAVDFFLELLRVDPERELELLPEERDEERVVAGTAMVRSPHVSSAASAVGSLHEPAFDISPVPLQSSWVI
jgi:hypothetical protein